MNSNIICRILKNVIITGGNGFIGRHLVRKILSCKRYSVAVISNTPIINDKYLSERKFLQDSPLRFLTADIRDGKAISNIFKDEKADTCIHLAAKISVVDSIKNPDETMEINAKGTMNVLEACHRSDTKNFIFASSAAVYGDVRDLPISENHTLSPLSPYGTSKMLAEQHVSSYSKLKKIQNAVMLRIFNVYGSGQAGQADVITKFAVRLSKGLPPVIYGGGIHTRDFISVDDVVEGILSSIRLVEEGEKNSDVDFSSPLVFNIGTGKPTSVNELAQKMIEIFGLDIQPTYQVGKQDDGVILHSYADMSKATEVLHFVPKTGIDAGLREIIGPTLIRK